MNYRMVKEIKLSKTVYSIQTRILGVWLTLFNTEKQNVADKKYDDLIFRSIRTVVRKDKV